MSQLDFNPEVALAQHPFLKAITTPDIWAIVQGVLSRNCAVLLVPEKKSLEGVQIDDLFALTHCAFLNPLNPSEMVTSNGLVGVSGRTSGSAKQLWVVSDKGKINTKDPTQTFDVIRPLFTKFSHDGKCLQTVSIVGETEIVVNKRTIRSIVLSSPIDFPGSPWKKSPSSSSEASSDFAFSQRNANQSALTTHTGKSLKSGKPSPVPVIAGSTASSPKVKAGAEEASFLARLKSAPEIQSSLTTFISRFSQQTPLAGEQSSIVRNYLDDVVGMMLNHRAWSKASDEDADIAAEAAEKYVMQKIYKFCFSSTTEDIARDKFISNRLAELQFITPEHLDIPTHYRDPQRLQQAIEELKAINTTKTPRGKLTRILNCCKAIYSILNRAAQQGNPAGADEFVPLLNYVVLHANPPQLHSNIQFILRFRAPNKLITEAGYYFTHLESTVAWLETLDASKLTIDPDTYNSLLAQNQEAIANKNLLAQQQKAQQQQLALSALSSVSASAKPSFSYANSNMTNAPQAARSTSSDLLDLSGLSSIPTSPSPTLASPLLADLIWHPSPSSASSTATTATSSTLTLTPTLSPNNSFSRASSGSRSVTRDDDSSEASVLELQDSESPLRFLNFNHVWDVKVGELEDLFQAYRMLAHENFQLRTDLYRSANKLGP
jgi:hypothetical protein